MRQLRSTITIFLLLLGSPLIAAEAAAIPPSGPEALSGAKVLYLGDSLSMGAFGRTFDETMRDKKLKVFTHVAGGASPYYWLRRYEPISCSIGYWEKTPEKERRVGYIRAVPKVEDLLEKYDPNIVVVQTGVNLYATLRSRRRSKEDNVKLVEVLISDMCAAVKTKGATSYWITPPDSHKKRFPEDLQVELTGLMKRVVSDHGGKVFESRKVTEWSMPYPSKSDGIHYGPVESRAWASKVAVDFAAYIDKLDSKLILAKGEEGEIKAKPLVADADGPIQTQSTDEPASSDQQKETKGAENRTIGSITSGASEMSAKAGNEIQLKLKLSNKSQVEHLNEVTYNSAFGIFEYDVEEVYKGEYPFDKVRIAHMIVLNKRYTGPNRFKIGSNYYLTLVKISKYPSLERVQMIDKLPINLDMPIYVCKF